MQNICKIQPNPGPIKRSPLLSGHALLSVAPPNLSGHLLKTRSYFHSIKRRQPFKGLRNESFVIVFALLSGHLEKVMTVKFNLFTQRSYESFLMK